MRPVLVSSPRRSTSPEPQIPRGGPPPIVEKRTRPPSSMRADSTAPSKAGMPQAICPPSKAGPAGQEATRSPLRLPTRSSVLVPMSMRATVRSSSRMPAASAQAAASAPTWPWMSGSPRTFAWGWMGSRSFRAAVSTAVVARRPASRSCWVMER